jgi:hypothetical protein
MLPWTASSQTKDWHGGEADARRRVPSAKQSEHSIRQLGQVVTSRASTMSACSTWARSSIFQFLCLGAIDPRWHFRRERSSLEKRWLDYGYLTGLTVASARTSQEARSRKRAGILRRAPLQNMKREDRLVGCLIVLYR